MCLCLCVDVFFLFFKCIYKEQIEILVRQRAEQTNTIQLLLMLLAAVMKITLPNQSNAIFRVVHTNFSSANAFPRFNARPLRYR